MSHPIDAGCTWDLAGYFPAFDGPEHRAFKDAVREGIAKHLKHAGLLVPLTEGNVAAWRAEIVAYEDLATRLGHLGSFTGCLSAADAASESYQAEEAALALLGAELEKFRSELLRGLAQASEAALAALLQRSEEHTSEVQSH